MHVTSNPSVLFSHVEHLTQYFAKLRYNISPNRLSCLLVAFLSYIHDSKGAISKC